MEQYFIQKSKIMRLTNLSLNSPQTATQSPLGLPMSSASLAFEQFEQPNRFNQGEQHERQSKTDFCIR